jgi:molybdopterin converting factor small subunit
MKVRVKLFATLGRFSGDSLPGTPFELDLPAGTILNELVVQLKIPTEEVKVCFVNGRVQEPGYVLADGDEIGIFPPIGGG